MKILTRMGDASNVELTLDELRKEFEEGSEAAAKKGKIPPLTENEIDYLVDMFAAPTRIWGVAARQRGRDDQGRVRQRPQLVAHVERRRGAGQPRGGRAPLRVDARLRLHGGLAQRLLGEAAALSQGARAAAHGAPQETTIFPLLYGFMPNLGLYYRPDGSFENPSDLLPLGKIDEARRTQEEALPGVHGRLHRDERLHARDGRRRHRLRHRRVHRRRRVPGRAQDHRARRQRDRPAGRDRHVVRDGAGLPRPARVQRHAPRRPLAAPAARALRAGRLRHLRPRVQHQHEEDHPVEPGARRSPS